MENKNDMKVLIETFLEYKELLTPIQESLSDFVDVYDSMKVEIEKLNETFGGDVVKNLQTVCHTLENQAEKAGNISSQITKFSEITNKYTTGVNNVLSMFSRIEGKLSSVNQLEKQAEEQIGKLDSILEEKKKSYNVRDLQKTLDSYNNNVQKVSEFINKDVADKLEQNHQKLEEIKTKNESFSKLMNDESANIETLVSTFQSSNELLKKVVENQDVNETYIFEILDKWADSRKVKIKK